jgi:F0F1-type ATP synthase assembly protein I
MAEILVMAGRDESGREYWKWSGLGLEFAGVVALFIYFGYLADRRWHSGPWGLIAGGAIGVIGGMYWLVKESLQMMKELGPPNEPGRDDRESEHRD